MLALNINELERITGITRQNIRFYEKKRLLHPARNTSNNYREYTQEDLDTLLVIKVLRKLDMPIEEIHKVLSGDVTFPQAVSYHLERLQEKKNELESCITVCRDLCHTELETLDAGRVLSKMEGMKQKGGVFMSIINDYKQIEKEESMRNFSFRPDTMVMNAGEFTDALLAYASENDLNLTITKAGMYPEFEIDGVEYTASRSIGRFGAVVQCTMSNPEGIEDENISDNKRRIYRFLIRNMLAVLLVVFIVGSRLLSGQGLWLSLVAAVCLVPLLAWTFKDRG